MLYDYILLFKRHRDTYKCNVYDCFIGLFFPTALQINRPYPAFIKGCLGIYDKIYNTVRDDVIEVKCHHYNIKQKFIMETVKRCIYMYTFIHSFLIFNLFTGKSFVNMIFK